MSKIFGFNLRWVFISKKSERLNAISYLILTFVISLIITGMLIVICNYQKVHLKNLQDLKSYKDWMGAEIPNEFDFESLDKKIYDLINQIEQNDPSTSNLFNAEDLGNQKCITGHMFSDVRLNVKPNCISYIFSNKATKLNKIESEVFRNFYVWLFNNIITCSNPTLDEFTNEKGLHSEAINDKKICFGKNLDNIEKHISKMLGVSNKDAEFNVPWIYIARKEGAMAIYPGYEPIKIDITQRPWYQAIFNGGSSVRMKGSSDVKLTYPFSDILSQKHQLLIRTYLHKFKIQNEDFVIGIDLYLNESKFTENKFDIENIKSEISGLIDNSTSNWQFKVFLIFMVMLLWLIKLASTFKTTHFKFKKIKYKYGNDDIGSGYEEEIDSTDYFTRKIANYILKKFDIDIGIDSRKNLDNLKFGELSHDLRGQEYWIVYKETCLNWKCLSMSFEQVNVENVGILKRTFGRELKPKVLWSCFDGEFSSAEEASMKKFLPDILISHPEGHSKSQYSLLSTSIDNSNDEFYNPPLFFRPTCAYSLDFYEINAPQLNRAYLTISSEQVRELYSNQNIKAVISSGYFERILSKNKIDFLICGASIERLVSFGDDSARLLINRETESVFKNILLDFSVKSRPLNRVNMPIEDEGNILPLFDFTLLGDECVFVTHKVSEATPVDSFTGKEGDVVFQISGYMSWRHADVAYYRHRYNELRKRAKPLDMNSISVKNDENK